MTGQEWGEWGVVGFSMSVLAWVIFRLTGTIVRLLRSNEGDHDDSAGD